MKHILIVLLVITCIIGCEKSSIRTFHIPKQVINVASLKIDKPLTWEIPKKWKEKDKTQFRVESRSIFDSNTNTNTDFSITKFPDEAGNLLSNINRWRNQLFLDPISEINFEDNIKKVNHDFLDITLIEINSKSKIINNKFFQSTYVAFFKFNDFTYYAKLTGETNHLDDLLNDFKVFLNSIDYEKNK